MDREANLRQIKGLVSLSKSSTLDERIKYLHEAATICLEQSSQATNDYIRASYRNRAVTIIDKAEKIKALMEQQSRPPTFGLKDMNSIGKALQEINSTPSVKEPPNSRYLPKKEQILMLKAGKIYNQTFKQWTREPNQEDFAESSVFVDETAYFMPPSLSEHFDDWRKPEAALPPLQLILQDSQGIEKQGPTMKTKTPINLVQDAAMNCSLVAGLCSIVGRTERGFSSILQGVMYPYDTTNDHPAFSANGKYMFRFYFNGHYRLVEVDDKLPVSKSDRVLHVTDRNNPTLLWPALVEKAYFKLRAGGYDWEGSNSATDLWILTGWIPEHVVLQDPYPREEEVWNRIYEPFHNGDLLLTIGTPAMTRELEEYHGLIGNHNYAILDLREEAGEPVLLIKNPWCESPESLNPKHELSNSFGKSGSAIPKGAKVEPGNFWMPLTKVFRLFHALYLNWSPAVFRSRKDLHFNWNLKEPRSRTLATSPQFSIFSEKGGTAFIVLARHLQDPEPEVREDESAEENLDTNRISHQQLTQISCSNPAKPPRASLDGFLSMYVLDKKGARSYLIGGYLANSLSLDGLQVYLSFKLEPKKSYTLAIKENLMPPIDQNFTLSVFSPFPIELSQARSRYSHSITIQSQWMAAKYGLASTSGAFNPQFRVIVPSPTPIAAFLDCDDELAKVNLKLCKRGVRMLDPKRIDVLTENSTEYELGGAWLETKGWEIGSNDGERSHTLLVLNMDDDYRGKFALRLETNVPVKVEEIPSEYAGHLLRLPKTIFSGAAMRMAVPILPSPEGDLLKILLRFDSNFIPGLPSASTASSSLQNSSKTLTSGNTGCQSLIKITLENGSGPNRSIVASTSTLDEEFRSVGKDGLRLAGVKVWRDMTQEPWDLFLVVERSGGCTLPGSEERFIVDVLTERPGTVQAETWRGWDD